MTEQRRRTKILATLGPATDAPGVLDALLRAGVDVVRLNFSHGDPSGQIARADAVRAAAARVGTEVGILVDLPGPKIRIETFANGKVKLLAGDTFTLIASDDAPPGDETQVGVSQGYGTAILGLVLPKARERGLACVLITCDADNIASRRSIEQHGGLPDAPYIPPDGSVTALRYWIELGD